MKPSELLVLNRADFSQLRETHPDAAVALLLALGQIAKSRRCAGAPTEKSSD